MSRVVGTGIDIVEIHALQTALQRTPSPRPRLFGTAESGHNRHVGSVERLDLARKHILHRGQRTS